MIYDKKYIDLFTYDISILYKYIYAITNLKLNTHDYDDKKNKYIDTIYITDYDKCNVLSLNEVHGGPNQHLFYNIFDKFDKFDKTLTNYSVLIGFIIYGIVHNYIHQIYFNYHIGNIVGNSNNI